MTTSIYHVLYSIRSIFFLCIILTALVACESDELEIESDNTDIDQMLFRAERNDGLEEDVLLEVRGDSLIGELPFSVQLDEMIASFNWGKADVFVNGIPQVSGVTTTDFSKTVNYEVVAEDGSRAIYRASVTYPTGLPAMYLSTNDNSPVASRDRYQDGTIKIYGGLQLSDLKVEEMEIRGRGNSTWSFPKKPYQIKFEDKTAVLDMPKDRRWILLANYSDKTMLRNYLAFQLSAMSNLQWTPKDQFVEVIFNGDYQGTYQLTQKVEETNNRLSLVDGGFLLEADQLGRLDEEDVYIETERLLFNVKEPTIDFNDADYTYIQRYMREIEDVLYGENFADPDTGYRNYLDVESFIDWYLISEIARNVDSKFYTSVFLHHERGGKLKMGPMWDFDLGFGNVDYSDSRYPDGFRIKNSIWVEQLFKDPAFVEQVKQRYQYFYDNKSKIIAQLRTQAKRLNAAQQANDERWETMGVYVWPNNVVLESYEAEVDFLVDWLEERMDWLAVAFEEL